MSRPFHERAKKKFGKTFRQKESVKQANKVFGVPFNVDSDAIPIVISRVVDYFNTTGKHVLERYYI